MSKNNDIGAKIKKTFSDLNIKEINIFKKDLVSVLSKATNYQNQISPFINFFF